jgi:DpnII restriction endonuclease
MAYPDNYWHCQVQLRGATGRDYAVENDMTYADLERRILIPWRKGAAFPVAGKVVSARDQVEVIRITRTDRPKDHYAAIHNERMRNSGISDLATDRRLLPLGEGQDFTNELLFEALDATPPEPDVGLMLRICERIPRAARILASRQRGNAPYVVADEYDVQDLLHAVLRCYLKYSIAEEPLGKVAGVKGGRADIAVEDLGVIIEVKYVRSPKDQVRLVEEFAQDTLLYSQWAPLKHFIYLCFNSQDLRDAEALTTLAGEQERNGRRFRVYVVLA